jgi:hypothetical protein
MVGAVHLKEKARIAVALAGWAWLTPLPPLVFNHANFFAPGTQSFTFDVELVVFKESFLKM